MLKRIHFTGITSFAFFFFACAGGKDVLFEQNPPFQIKHAISQDWVSGVQGGGSGTNISVYMGDVHEDIQVKEIYYGDTMAIAERHPRDIDKYVARFANSTNRNIIMDENPKKEAENTPPLKSLFNLEKDEIVISYLHEGELKFFKFSEVEKKPILAYPGVNPNGREN